MISRNNCEPPFFSVIICTFNRDKLLKRALESLIKQSEKDWEALIIDDGSNDDTYNIIKEYCHKYKNISYIYHYNRGPGLSKNTGIILSHGLYITFLDSDDEYMPNHLKIRKQILKKNLDIDILYGGAKIIGYPYVPDFNNSSKKIHIDNCVIGGTFVIKRQVINNLGGFSALKFGDDTEFFSRARIAGIKILKIDDKTYIYHREHNVSICNTVIINE